MQTLSDLVFAYVVNALWEIPLLVLATEATARLFASVRAAVVYRLWLGCLLLCVVLPGASFFHAQARSVSNDAASAVMDTVPTAAGVTVRDTQNSTELQNSVLVPVGKHVAGKRISWRSVAKVSVCFLYLATVLFALFRLAFSLLQTRSLVGNARPAILAPEIAAVWDACVTAFRMERVELLSSSAVSSPATLTWGRAVVILPADLQGAEPEELAAAFSHELAHIQRGDFLANLFCEAVAALLFFHPALHWVRRRLQETRELACDDIAANAVPDRHTYARNLLRLAERMCSGAASSQSNCALGVFEAEILEKRVMNLIETKLKLTLPRLCFSLAVGVVLVVGSCVVGASFGLSPVLAHAVIKAEAVAAVARPVAVEAPAAAPISSPEPVAAPSVEPMTRESEPVAIAPAPAAAVPEAAEEISAKPAVDNVVITPYTGDGRNTNLSINGDTLRGTGVWLTSLLYKAYNTPPAAIFGLTAAQGAARFNITAKIVATDAGLPGSPDARRYMLQTLLANHFGVKVHAETKTLPVYQLVVDGEVKFNAAAADARSGYTADDSHLTGQMFSMPALAEDLSDKMRTMVVDKTGLGGKYDIDLRWPQGSSPRNAGLGEDSQRTDAPMDGYQLGIASAVQKQLGLKIEPGEAPVKTLVVDRIELPGK